MVKQLNLIQRFILFSLVSIIITGVLLVQALTFLFKQYIFLDSKNTTLYSIESFLQPEVKNESSIENIAKDTSLLKSLTFNLKEYDDVISVRLWSPNGTVLFSSESNLIGKRFRIKSDLEKALKGIPISSVSDLNDNENKYLRVQNDKLIEIYYPIFGENRRVIGVFEIYKSYDKVKEYMHSVLLYIWIITFMGLSILYILLFKTIKRTYATLVYQNVKLSKINTELENSYFDTISAFSTAVDLKDSYTKHHSQRVTEYSLKIAYELDLDEKRISNLEKAALFHDIGKIGIPDLILNKQGQLTDEEFEVIKSHPTKGTTLIEHTKFLSDIVPFVKFHHERIDGKGYPQGLKGEEIPLEARIIAVADTFDAITSDRPYRKGSSIESAITELQFVKNSQLDGKIVDAFIKILQKENITVEDKIAK